MELPRCPICYEIIDEPVVYPCQHEVCKGCFERSIETANLWCPLCRKRVSSWARRHFKNPVHTLRREEIQKELASLDSDTLRETSLVIPRHVLSKEGEIQREYLREISKVREEKIEEERRGEAEAQKLLLEEEAQLQMRQLELEKESQLGYAAAKFLEEEEKRKEYQQLEEDRRVAELLTQEFIFQQIENQQKQTAEDQKIAERLSKEMKVVHPSTKAFPPGPIKKNSKLKTPRRKAAIHPKCASPSQSLAIKPITFWLKPTNQT